MQKVIYDQRPKPRGIVVLGESTPTFPEDFQRKLQDYDKDLLLTWHRPPHWPRHRRGVWKIEQCIRHNGGFDLNGRPKHSHVCNRVYVMMIQDEERTPKPLGEWVFEKLREMRANSESYGGQTERGLRNFIEASNAIDQELESKREAAREDVKQHNRKFNRVTFNRLGNLIEQHDLRPNR